MENKFEFDRWLDSEFTSQMIPDEKKKILVRFWSNMHVDLMEDWYQDRLKIESNPTKVSQYKKNVFSILREHKVNPFLTMEEERKELRLQFRKGRLFPG